MFRKNKSFPFSLFFSLPFRTFCYSIPKFTTKPNEKGVLVMIVIYLLRFFFSSSKSNKMNK